MTDIDAQIRTELDRVLMEYDAADRVAREARAEADMRTREANDLAEVAQKLRMSLYALRGAKSGLGDANAENRERRWELRREL